MPPLLDYFHKNAYTLVHVNDHLTQRDNDPQATLFTSFPKAFLPEPNWLVPVTKDCRKQKAFLHRSRA